MEFKKIFRKINPWVIFWIIFGTCFCVSVVIITYGVYKEDFLRMIIGGVTVIFVFVAGFGLRTFTTQTYLRKRQKMKLKIVS